MNFSFRSLSGITILAVMCVPALVFGQSQVVSYGIGASAYTAKDGNLPFWFYANTDGVVDPESSNLITRLYSYYTSVDTANSFRVRTGFDAYSRFSQNNTLVFNELYGSIGYKFIDLKVGRFYQTLGLTDDDLTMGSMIVSRNATPIPRIQLSTNGFTDIPLMQGYVQFKALFAHGWFDDERYVSNPYLHQKYFYLKINYKVIEAMGGIIHNVTWGGVDPDSGQLPSSFSDYLRVISGMGAAPGAPGGEVTNVIGNSVGAYDFRLNLNFDDFQFKAYRLFYLEDKVSTRFRSPWDGIWGVGIELTDENSFINEILWEHMNTKRQDSFDDEPRGTASYYYNFIYESGWTYEGNVIGNPLILAEPNPNFMMRGPISNNIIVAHHIGIQGRPADRFRYKTFFTYSRNYGTVANQRQQEQPYELIGRVDEYSMFFQAQYLLAPKYGLSLTGALAFDMGELYENNRLGFQLGIRWDRIIPVN
ncbi:MAG TPA: capsule assembly Wzi family protein [Balneolaceae bacterium]